MVTTPATRGLWPPRPPGAGAGIRLPSELHRCVVAAACASVGHRDRRISTRDPTHRAPAQRPGAGVLRSAAAETGCSPAPSCYLGLCAFISGSGSSGSKWARIHIGGRVDAPRHRSPPGTTCPTWTITRRLVRVVTDRINPFARRPVRTDPFIGARDHVRVDTSVLRVLPGVTSGPARGAETLDGTAGVRGGTPAGPAGWMGGGAPGRNRVRGDKVRGGCGRPCEGRPMLVTVIVEFPNVVDPSHRRRHLTAPDAPEINPVWYGRLNVAVQTVTMPTVSPRLSVRPSARAAPGRHRVAQPHETPRRRTVRLPRRSAPRWFVRRSSPVPGRANHSPRSVPRPGDRSARRLPCTAAGPRVPVAVRRPRLINRRRRNPASRRVVR